MTKKNNKPVAQYRNGNIKSCVWQNKAEKGKIPTVRNTISIQKSYKDPKSGEWVNLELRLFPAEAARLVSVLQAAYESCVLKKVV
jgi:hypothetical protein